MTKREIKEYVDAAEQNWAEGDRGTDLTNHKDLFNWSKFLKGTTFGNKWVVEEFWLVWHKRDETPVFWARLQDGSTWTIWPKKLSAEPAEHQGLYW